MRERLRIKSYIRHLNWLVILVIAGNKFLLRPWVREHFDPSVGLIIVNSLPNFVEAVIGTVALSGIGLVLRARFPQFLSNLKENTVYVTATLLASIYVLTQEFNLHSLGGNNTYDPYDVVASVTGLIFIYVILNTYGMLTNQHALEE